MTKYLVVLTATVAVIYCQIEFPELPTQRLDSVPAEVSAILTFNYYFFHVQGIKNGTT